MKQTFKAKLIGKGPTGSWTFLPIPFSVEERFGSKAQVRVKGTINGFAFQNSLMPEGDGTHLMMVSKILKDGAGCANGDTVSVVMDVDASDRKVTVPLELRAALKAKPAAKAFFEELSYSRQREYADWISGAKRPETKAARVGKSVELLLQKKKLT
ncbi:MAG TPA: YdeI/OmpD-associated family protein [Opitutaceae bacterium]|jgi:hypothetical protein|nr:YdeI/OmpD-associated family protein [Opitutaceae bacterium]